MLSPAVHLTDKNIMEPPKFWAKSADEGAFWLPLQTHLKDTQDVAGYLWDYWVPAKTKKIIAESYFVTEDQAKEFYKYIALTHDIGKISVPFWDRSYISSSTGDLSNRIRQNWESYSPSSDDDYNKNRHEKASDFFLQHHQNLKTTLSSTVALHHGRSEKLPTGLSRMRRILGGESFISYGETLYDEYLKQFASDFDPGIVPDEAAVQGMFLLNTLLVMADWIASSPEFFPLISSTQEVSASDLIGAWGEARKEAAFGKLDGRIPEKFTPGPNLETLLEEPLPSVLQHFFGFDEPSIVQTEMWNAVSSSGVEAELYIAEAEMGSGKTEAALLAAMKLLVKTNSSGFFIGLPTMATTDAMAKRVIPFLEKLAELDEGVFSTSVIHSKSLFSSVKTVSMKNGHGLMDAGWFQSRTGKILNSFSIGTIDQVLMMSLNAKHLLWRHLGLSSKVVILDEIHSADEYMLIYLANALKWLAAYNCPVIALSATISDEQKQMLVDAYNEGKRMR